MAAKAKAKATPKSTANKKKPKPLKIVDSYDILVLGCGGTGTFFLKEFNHYIARNPDAMKKIHSLYIADGDTVEEKNLDRQCFDTEDVGRNKASVFAEILNDAKEEMQVGYSSNKWEAIPSYITSVETIEQHFKKVQRLGGFYSSDSFDARIAMIICCVDNNAARKMCEEYFRKSEFCFLYDSGNDFSTGEVCYAHRFKGKTLSYEKSYSFPQINAKGERHVTELSCAELNQSAPQHFLTNLTAAQWLLRGCIRLFTDVKKKSVLERIYPQLGYVFFDAFSGVSEYVERSFRTEQQETKAA